MGEVYKARDTRLNRIVALKVANERLSDRFEREARAVAALNHPHVCQLYDIGPDYLVMEFVEGAPIRPGDTPQRIIELALQITDGLVAAHAAGVVHRDLKPANILVTRSGDVKLLDFGLATLSDAHEAVSDSNTRAATDPGTTVGTVGYMSPEQARGEAVDARTDLWSLGVVLYELATGERPFDGATAPVIFEALLNKTPAPIRERNPRIPAELERIVGRLLDKDRETRYQSAADLRADLRRVERDSSGATAAAPAPERKRSRVALIAGAVGAVALLLIAAAIWRINSTPPAVTSPSEYIQLTNFTDSATAPSLSPDGRMVTFIRGGEAFLSRGQIYVKLLPNGESVKLTSDAMTKYGPVFTPDGAHIVYTRVGGAGAAVGGGAWDSWSVPALGGEPTRMLPNASGLTWLGEHRVLFSEIRTGLHMGIVTATEGRAESRDIYFPSHERAMAHFSYASPDRESVLIVEMDRTAAFQPCRLVPLAGGSTGRQVGPTGRCTSAGWSPDGRWMYFAATVGGNSHLWRQRFPDGRPEQITFGPTEEEGIAVAADGRSLITSIGQRQNTLWIQDGDTERPISSEGYVSNTEEESDPRLSADGTRAYCLMRPNTTSSTFELYTVNIASGKADRLFPGVVVKDFDISRDDLEVVYTTLENGEPQIWIAPLDRRSSPRLVTRSGDHGSFGANGEVIFRQLDERVNYLARVNKDGGGRQRISSIAVIDKQDVSPDGEWVVAAAAEEGKDASRQVLAIPVHGGVAQTICQERCIARWSDDGRMFYLDIATGAMRGKTVAIPVPAGRTLPVVPDAVVKQSDEWATAAGARVLEGSTSALPGVARFVFVKTNVQRNLFRIPIH
jgi:eukaryotic-like serine/threonine-protein kinase